MPTTLPHLEAQARGEWMRAPDPSAPRAASQAATIPFWSRLFLSDTPGIPGTNKPDERMTAARWPRNSNIAKSASPRLTRWSVRAKPKTPTKPCQTLHRPPANPEAATAAGRAAVRNVKETTKTRPAVKTAAKAAKAANLAKAANPAKAMPTANRGVARCQNPPS